MAHPDRQALVIIFRKGTSKKWGEYPIQGRKGLYFVWRLPFLPKTTLAARKQGRAAPETP
jgi:hypothetical protein